MPSGYGDRTLPRIAWLLARQGLWAGFPASRESARGLAVRMVGAGLYGRTVRANHVAPSIPMLVRLAREERLRQINNDYEEYMRYSDRIKRRAKPPQRGSGTISNAAFRAMTEAEQERIRGIILRAYCEKTMSMVTISSMGYPMAVIKEVCAPYYDANRKRANGYYHASMGDVGLGTVQG